MVLAVDCTHGEMVLAREAKPLAFRIDTRKSSEVGSLHEVLLEDSWLRSQGLHTTRHLWSISVMITGHYQRSSVTLHISMLAGRRPPTP